MVRILAVTSSPDKPVAACRCPYQYAVLVMQRAGEPVHLDVGEIFQLGAFRYQLFDTRLPGSELRSSLNTSFRLSIREVCSDALERDAAHQPPAGWANQE